MANFFDWDDLLRKDRGKKLAKYGIDLDANPRGQMPDAYYGREHEKGEFNLDGDAIYNPQLSLVERQKLFEHDAPGSYSPPCTPRPKPAIGMICTHYTPRSPAIRVAAMIVAITPDETRLWAISEYARGPDEYRFHSSSKLYFSVKAEPKSRLDNRVTLLLGIDDATWFSSKLWHSREMFEGRRFPDDMEKIQAVLRKKHNILR